jgi:hypothetical protein
MGKRKTFLDNTLGVRVDTPTMGWPEQHAERERVAVSTCVSHVIERAARQDLVQHEVENAGEARTVRAGPRPGRDPGASGELLTSRVNASGTDRNLHG